MPATLSASPLRALQAFNAVARAGSVAAAAEELAVTPSAISHLVRQLERRLGAALFTRKGRGLALTPDGERLAAAVGPALATIGDALSGFMRRGAELRISTLSSFAVHWLIPRLSRFQAQHPDIELLLSTSTRIVDLTAEAFDCAIRLGQGGWPGVTAEALYREELVAACSPQWLAARRIRSPRDLVRVKLLHAKARRQDWVQWFKAAGITDFKAGGGPVFETRALAIQAAIAQMGIVVVDPRFIEVSLAAGPRGDASGRRIPPMARRRSGAGAESRGGPQREGPLSTLKITTTCGPSSCVPPTVAWSARTRSRLGSSGPASASLRRASR